MNKILVASFISLIPFSYSYAANEPLKEVTQIVEIPNMTQKQIYDASKVWLAKSFKSSNAVIQYEDATTGTIIGKGNMDYPCVGVLNCMGHANYKVLFTLKIDTKDSKARLTFNDLLLKTSTTAIGSSVVNGNEIGIYVKTDKENIENGLKKVISQYESDIKNSSSDTNW